MLKKTLRDVWWKLLLETDAHETWHTKARSTAGRKHVDWLLGSGHCFFLHLSWRSGQSGPLPISPTARMSSGSSPTCLSTILWSQKPLHKPDGDIFFLKNRKQYCATQWQKWKRTGIQTHMTNIRLIKGAFYIRLLYSKGDRQPPAPHGPISFGALNYVHTGGQTHMAAFT